MPAIRSLVMNWKQILVLLIIAGAGPTQWFDKGCFEECYRYGPEEFTQVVKPICKKAALVTRPDTALETVVRAYKEAISGRPGPVLVQIPFDIQHTEIEIESIPEADPTRRWSERINLSELETEEYLRVGCKFAGRCPRVMEHCKTEPPPYIQVGDAQVKCFLYKENGGN